MRGNWEQDMPHAARRLGVLFVLVPIMAAACGQASPSTGAPIREDTIRLGDLAQHYRRTGHGTPVLLVHGLTNTWRVWRPHIDALAATHDLIIPDLRGHGDTPNPVSTLTPVQVAQDMLALLDALGLKQFQVAGFSFGGHVALRMAALQPERVEAMVVIAGTHRLIGSAVKTHEDAAKGGLPAGWYLDEVRKWHPGGEAQVQQLIRQGAAAGLTEDFPMPDASLAAIRARTLIIQGDRDDWFPLDVPLDLYRKIPKAQLWVIPNTTHSAVFFSDFAPAGIDLGGTALAARIFPDVVNSFLEAQAP
jgi:pimeloyl-ACP methyl ester carboxylesterase